MNSQKLLTVQIFLYFTVSAFSQLAFSQSINASSAYILHCSGCHGTDGAGSHIGGIPSLSLVKSFTSDIDGRKYITQVPGIAYSGLTNQDIAAVVNYVAARWGDPGIPFQKFTSEEVNNLRATNIDDIVGFRRSLTKRYIAEGKLVANYPWP